MLTPQACGMSPFMKNVINCMTGYGKVDKTDLKECEQSDSLTAEGRARNNRLKITEIKAISRLG